MSDFSASFSVLLSCRRPSCSDLSCFWRNMGFWQRAVRAVAWSWESAASAISNKHNKQSDTQTKGGEITERDVLRASGVSLTFIHTGNPRPFKPVPSVPRTRLGPPFPHIGTTLTPRNPSFRTPQAPSTEPQKPIHTLTHLDLRSCKATVTHTYPQRLCPGPALP